jgi:hypothetical protein
LSGSRVVVDVVHELVWGSLLFAEGLGWSGRESDIDGKRSTSSDRRRVKGREGSSSKSRYSKKVESRKKENPICHE